jgi:hypothetical protein
MVKRVDSNVVNSYNQSLQVFDQVEANIKVGNEATSSAELVAEAVAEIPSFIFGSFYKEDVWEENSREQVLCGRYGHVLGSSMDIFEQCIYCGVNVDSKGVLDINSVRRSNCKHKLEYVADRCTLCHSKKLR